MDDVKKGSREVETDAKQAWRKADGDESIDDKLANAGDEIRKDLGNAGDEIRDALDDTTQDAKREYRESRDRRQGRVAAVRRRGVPRRQGRQCRRRDPQGPRQRGRRAARRPLTAVPHRITGPGGDAGALSCPGARTAPRRRPRVAAYPRAARVRGSVARTQGGTSGMSEADHAAPDIDQRIEGVVDTPTCSRSPRRSPAGAERSWRRG